jgi:membrane fusion protein, multidrug efflux system
MKALPIFSAAILAGLFAGCSRSTTETLQALPPLKARVIAVRTENAPVTTEITGTVRPIERAQLAAKVMGAIEELPVTLGQRVKRGDVLVKISAGEITARVAQVKSQLNAAARDLKRERSLLAKGASTADMVKGLEDRHAGGVAMLREAEVMLGYATLRAPFDGVVARKLVHAGDLAAPGAPLLEIEGAAGFEVEAGVPDSLAATLTVGASLPVELPAAGVSLTGKAAEVSSAADPGARTVTIKITLPEHPAVRSGQFARIQLPAAVVPMLLAPASAVSIAGQMECVFVSSNDNRVVLRLVKTGARRGDRIEILSGLDDGERVVLSPPAGLREGQALELQP